MTNAEWLVMIVATVATVGAFSLIVEIAYRVRFRSFAKREAERFAWQAAAIRSR